MDGPGEEIDKPRELLAARRACEELFAMLQRWFAVPSRVTIDLAAVDSAVDELADPQLVMAMAMRKLQALHLLTTPGVVTTTDVVLTVIQDLERALLQAPAMHLSQEAEATDWDAELAALDEDPPAGAEAEPATDAEGADLPGPGAEPEPGEVNVFREHHAALHEAAKAVLHVSDGRIVRLR